MEDEPVELIEFLAPYPTQVQDQALRARKFLFDLLSPVTELHFDATAAVCAGFAYTTKTQEIFVNIAVYSDHITLVFGYGATLNDPQHRLKGEGSRVRHIRLKSDEDLKDPYVLDLIRQSSEAAKGRFDPAPPSRIIKVYSGPKRRPAWRLAGQGAALRTTGTWNLNTVVRASSPAQVTGIQTNRE